ncbi:MAG: MBL fold metallo-hydrolase [Alphaproteobacteria bacterium]|jgi:glyoxylase-like metal-dependent hydrolase (beta-lactamase superfamily II)|nr:MBL fold metallo-hydrolase [Alphaproteobacteria bacterium]
MDEAAGPVVRAFYSAATGSWQYVVHDPATKQAATIDVVWNYDPVHGRTSTESADEVLAYVEAEGLDVVWLLDTHPHADHFIAAPYLQSKLGAPRGIGAMVTGVQELWRAIYDLGDDFPIDGSQWDRLFADGDGFALGELTGRVLFTPGHTLASISYVIGDAAFVADTLMMPDSGTSRADFPGGDAGRLYDSIQRLLRLPDDTRVFVGHDYAPNGREPRCESTVKVQRESNLHLEGGVSKADYVRLRTARDATLTLPERMLAALQVNIRGGRKPPPHRNGTSYLRIPLDRF